MADNLTETQFIPAHKHFAAMVLCTILTVVLIACQNAPVAPTVLSGQGFSQHQTRDSISLELRTSKKDITIAEHLELVLEASVPEHIEVEFPRYSASLGDFTLKDTRMPPARMTGSGDAVRVTHQATYILEPYLGGTYTIPAMAVTFRDKTDNDKVFKLLTEKIEFAVKSLLPPAADRVEIKDIKPPLPLPPNRIGQFLVAGLVLLLAALFIAGFSYWKQRAAKKTPAEVQLRPEEIALLELEKLLADDLLTRREIKLFHLRISDILRHYIENRFGLNAPERTTEEFLSELSLKNQSHSTLLSNHKALLADFLNQCDLVKFAKHEPTVAECEKTVAICREFVEKTREKDPRAQGVEGSRGN